MTTDNPTQSEKLEPCKWCADGNKPDFLDSDGTKVSITGNDGILSHAYEEYWWPCLKFGVELRCSRAAVAAPQGDAEHERPPVVHLGNMPIEEEDRHTRAELERRFEISERLRNDPFVAEEWTDEFPQVEEALYWVRHKQNHTDLDVARLRNGSLYPTDGGAMSKSRRRDWEYLGPINRFTTPVAPSPIPEQENHT